MTRAVKEWIAKHDDQTIPRSVRIRVFETHGGKCALTGKRLYPGEYDIDHKKRLKDGGEHRESNLQPVWREKHKEKTAAETKAGKKAEKVKDKHFSPKPEGKIRSAPFFKASKPKGNEAWIAAMAAKGKRIVPRRGVS